MLKKRWIFLINLFLFLLLLARNPFSERTLIPNFEPYPDSIHYINPARSFIEAGVFNIVREDRTIKTNVPPLYSISLIPLLMVKNDPRMIYFTNMVLAILSFNFYYLIILKVLTNKSKTVNGILLFGALYLYATNFYLYWIPSLAMAENLTLALFMGGVYLLLLPSTLKRIVLAGLVVIAFYMTKYASLPLAGLYFVSYLVKTSIEQPKIKNTNINPSLIFIIVSMITFLTYSLWEWGSKGSTLLVTLLNLIRPQSNSGQQVSSDIWFSLSYMSKYLPQYLKSLMGGEKIPFLWKSTPIIPLYVGIPALIGFALGLFQRRYRFLVMSLVVMLFSSILFMSTFYSLDMRYLYFSIPTLLFGFVIFWDIILNSKFKLTLLPIRNISKFIPYILFSFVLMYSFCTSFVRIKNQVMLNLKYSETPWYYISVLEMNKYFKNAPQSHEKIPVLISPMIPYFIDFYSNGNYSLLPLSTRQEFYFARKEVWGNFDYKDLITLYHKAISRGYPLYVDNYGLGELKQLHTDFKKIQDDFDLELVHTGCFNACNIWKLKEKTL